MSVCLTSRFVLNLVLTLCTKMCRVNFRLEQDIRVLWPLLCMKVRSNFYEFLY